MEMLVEYQLPRTSKRADVVLAGQHPQTGRASYLVVELKQWSEGERFEDSDVLVRIDGYGNDPVLHPLEQVRGYCDYLTDFVVTLTEDEHELASAAYLHNATNVGIADLMDMAIPDPARPARLFSGQDRGDFLDFLRSRLAPGVPQRIAEVYGLGERDAFDDVRLRVLHGVIAYVDEHVWRDAIDDVHRHILEDEEGDGWFPELAEQRPLRAEKPPGLSWGLDDGPARSIPAREGALFLPPRHAIRDMTMKQKDAAALARAHLADGGSRVSVDENYVFPNPYRDLWIIG